MNTEASRQKNMPLEQSLDMMEQLLPYMASILNDADVKSVTESVRKSKGMLPAGDTMFSLMPLFIQREKHREDLFHILAIIKGCTVEDAKQLSLADTMSALSFTGEMSRFFSSCLRLALTV